MAKKSNIESSKIKFVDLIKILKENLNDWNWTTNCDFLNLKDQLVIKQFIDSQTQYTVVEYIISKNPMISETEGVEKIKAIDLAKTFNILLSYVTNLNVEFEYINFENLDILEESGFIDYLKSKIKHSNYELYCKRLDEVLNQDAISQTKELLETLTGVLQELGEDMAKETEAFKGNMEKMTPEMLDKVQNLIEFNDPMTKQLKEHIQNSASEDMTKDNADLLKQLEELKGMPFNEAFSNNPDLIKKTIQDTMNNMQTKNFVNKKKK